MSSVWQIQRNFLFFFSRVFVWIQVENIILENIHVSMSSINNRTCEWMKGRDFFQKLTNARLTITDVMWMLLARIPWAHTNVLAKLDILEMAANALVSTEVCFQTSSIFYPKTSQTDWIHSFLMLFVNLKKVVYVSLVSFYGHHTVYVQCCN